MTRLTCTGCSKYDDKLVLAGGENQNKDASKFLATLLVT